MIDTLRHVRIRKWLSVSIVCAGVLPFLEAVPAGADASPTCRVEQVGVGAIRPHTDSYLAHVTRRGDQVVFGSNLDLVGTNPQRDQEVFSYRPGTATFAQLTHTSGGLSPWSMSDDGNLVALTSTSSLVTPNADNNHEVYLLDVGGEQMVRLTDTSADNNDYPQISGDGSLVVYATRNNPTGSNDAGLRQLFGYDVGDGTTVQLTNISTDAGLGLAGVSHDGGRLAFESDADLTGENPDHSYEAFLIDTSGGVVTQVTDQEGAPSGVESMNPQGSRVLIRSSHDLTGENADENQELYLYRVPTGRLVQLTHSTGTSINRSADLSADGTRVAFHSDADYTGENPDRNLEVFLYDLASRSYTQVTNTSGAQQETIVDISGDGRRLVFGSNLDLTGSHADDYEDVFLARCRVAESGFVDVVPSATYSRAVTWARANDLTGPGAQVRYRPGSVATRSRVIATLWELVDEPTGSPPHPPYSDVSANAPYGRALDWAVDAGVVHTPPVGRFRPSDGVTRAQLASMLWRMVGEPNGSPSASLTDVPGTSTVAPAVDWVVAKGLMSPSGGRFRPQDPVMRGQFAGTLYRMAASPSAWSTWSGELPGALLFP